MSLSNVSEQSDWEVPSISKRSKLERTVDDDCSNCQTNMASELDERIFTYVSDSDTLDFAKFGFLKLGPLCNASESCSFTEATCNFKTVRNENNLALILEFSQLFSRGITLLSDVKNNKRELEQHELEAIKLLDSFFKDKDKHEQSLNKVLRGHQTEDEKKGFSETEIRVALAEHLLGKLAPGKSYVVDRRLKKKGKCRCGYDFCKSNPVFGSTGVGHEEVWHGFIDIMFSSHYGVPETAAVFTNETLDSTTLSCPFDDLDCDDQNEEGSLGGKTISEVKLSRTGAESQAIAQTIVFSFIQRKRHPQFSNFFIPNILISPNSFRIIMYDAVNDILICSLPLSIFQSYPSKSFEIASIIILWMVLHYRIFCDGIDVSLIKKADIEIKSIQANFKERANEKLDFYVNRPKFGVQGFPIVQRESLPSFESLSLGVHILPKK
uniref:Uncharacterized protein LOC111129982 n=1 Tax=Crassostrea virginica TaxID=6565 RepID=A0A8B8DVM6_CRAVI|nr:uncharacterized protein LOC111129982 [Crassostrea virginica]XP_022332268.1 uncharacterized protein LOC111129982 [Crassostrea virginica]